MSRPPDDSSEPLDVGVVASAAVEPCPERRADAAQEKYSPPVPIKTYQWEDLRRVKKLGGYPWTYLQQSSLSDEDRAAIMSAKLETEPSANGGSSEILTPVDHSQTETGAVPLADDVAEVAEDAALITPVDHTKVFKGSEEEHIYEPIQKPGDETVQSSDGPVECSAHSKEAEEEQKPGDSDKNSIKEEILKEAAKHEMRFGKPPPLSRANEEQSMSVDEEKSYLEKQILKSTSLDEDYNKWSKLNDHEYEPVNAPAENTEQHVEPSPVHIVDMEDIAHIDDDDASSTTSAERKFLRIPLDDELVVPADGHLEDEAMSGEGISIDSRYLNATPTTTESRTDCEINTSQVDSSALEDLPLQRGSRKKATLATAENTHGQNFQQRVKTSASKLKTKLKGIRKARERKVTDRPLKERSPKAEKRTAKEEKKAAKSERPTLLDRARNMERPKFSMPKLPDRPKINMPNISMPKMPERRKISLPKMPDISFPSMGRKERKGEEAIPEATVTTEASTASQPTGTDNSSLSEAASKTKKKKFDFDFSTYPKMLSRNKKPKPDPELEENLEHSESKSTFFGSLPDWVTMPRKKSTKKEPSEKKDSLKENNKNGKSNGNKAKEKNQDHEEGDSQKLRNGRSNSNEPEGSSDSDDEEIGHIDDILLYYAPTVEDTEREIKMKKAALEKKINVEEINASLRAANQQVEPKVDVAPSPKVDKIIQKQESVIVPVKQQEILVASPKVVYEERVPTPEEEEEEHLPVSGRPYSIHSTENPPPEAFRSERSEESSERGGVMEEEANPDGFFGREKGISQDNIDVSLYLSSEIRNAFEVPINALSQMTENGRGYYEYNNQPVEEYPLPEDSPVSERIVVPPTKTLRKKKGKKKIPDEAQENEYNIMQSQQQSNEPVKQNQEEPSPFDSYKTFPPARPSRSRKGSVVSKKMPDSQSLHGGEIEMDNDGKHNMPVIPLRRKKSLTSFKSLNVGEESALRRNDQNMSLQEIRSTSYRQTASPSIHPEVPRRRFRSRSTIHTINDDDRTSHGADSLVSEEREHPDFQSIDISENSLPGYARIDKKRNIPDAPVVQPVTQPPPRRKRKKRDTQFFTVPRKLKEGSPPVRPLRNYSTLKTRKSHDRSFPSISSQDKENISDTQYIEIEDDDNSRNLQSGAVIEKMKTRPLPAPPRPPRKVRSEFETSSEDILKEIHPDNIPESNRLRPEDKSNISKSSNESIVKATLLIGSQVNIITEVTPGVCVQDDNFEELHDLQLSDSNVEIELTPIQPDIPDQISSVVVEPSGKVKLTSDNFRTTIESFGEFTLPENVVEVEMSTQTDPLPDDFCCEEVVQEPTDIILAPTRRRRASRDLQAAKTTADKIPEKSAEVVSPDPVPIEEERFEQVQAYIDHLPTVIPQLSTEEREVPAQIQPQRSFSSEIPSEAQDLAPVRIGLLEQQSQDRYSESSIPRFEETDVEDSLIRFARIQQSSLLGRPEVNADVPQVPPTLALPETLRVERLQVGDLDVDRLTVSELLAQKILVSEIDGMSLKLNDISSLSGNIVTDEIKLPPNFIEDIISRIQSLRLSEDSEASTSEPKTVIEKHITYVKEESTNTDDSLPGPSESRPAEVPAPTASQVLSQAVPYPHIYVLPPSFYQQTPAESPRVRPEVVRPAADTDIPVDSGPSTSSLATSSPMVVPVAPEPTIPDLSAQLLRACHSSASRSARQIIMELSSRLNTGDEKQDAKTAIIIIVVLLAGLILLGFGSRGESVHHHHWEYFNPPNGDRPL